MIKQDRFQCIASVVSECEAMVLSLDCMELQKVGYVMCWWLNGL